VRKEPVCPPKDAPDSVYNAWLMAHQDWKREQALLAPKARPPTAPERDLPDELYRDAAMPFPIDVLPEELRTWALASAHFNQVPKSMAATYAIMAAMTASIHLNVQFRVGWTEPVVCQMLLAAAPSERKSPVFAGAFAPVYEWSRREKQRHAASRAKLQSDIDAEMLNEDGESRPLAAGSPEARRVAELRQQLAAVKPPRRRIADDITPEEFMRQMAENDDTMCLVSDEADVFQSFGGRYNKGESKLAPLLKGWDAKSPLIYDRVGGGGGKQRTNIVIEKPRAGISITGQHGVLRALVANETFADKGMLARLLFVVLPERTRKRELHPEGIPRPIVDAYNEAILRMFEFDDSEPLQLANQVDFGNGWTTPKWLDDLRARVEAGQLEGGEFSKTSNWAGKLVSNMGRVASVLEAMGGGGEANLVALSEFFIVHARRAMGGPTSVAPAAGTELDLLATMVAKIGAKYPPAPTSADKSVSASKPFTYRDVARCWGRLQSLPREQLEAHVATLIGMGHLDELPNEDAKNVGDKGYVRRFVLVSRVGVEPVPEQPSDMSDGMPSVPKSALDEEFFGDGWEQEL